MRDAPNLEPRPLLSPGSSPGLLLPGALPRTDPSLRPSARQLLPRLAGRFITTATAELDHVREQGPPLFGPQRSRFADGQSTQAERPHADSNQSSYWKAKNEQTSSNLTLPPFSENQQEIRCARVGIKAYGTHTTGCRASIFEGNPLLETSDSPFIDLALHIDLVLTLIAKRRMEKDVCRIAIIGEQQQPSRFAVQSTDREESTDISRQQIHDGATPLVVPNRRHHASWLVDDPIARLLAQQPFSVQPDIVDTRVSAIAQIRDPTIHGHALFDQELLYIAARTEACAGQQLLKSNGTGRADAIDTMRRRGSRFLPYPRLRRYVGLRCTRFSRLSSMFR
jgi:hypothetical protein